MLRTNLSACAFRFGLLGGDFADSTPKPPSARDRDRVYSMAGAWNSAAAISRYDPSPQSMTTVRPRNKTGTALRSTTTSSSCSAT